MITNKTWDEERALYGVQGEKLDGCTFEGPADGESALKECKDIVVSNSKFALRYPLWHCNGFELSNCTLTDTCRAPLWYSTDGVIDNCNIDGVKTLRECGNIVVKNSRVVSPEFGWKCNGVFLQNVDITSEYILFGSHNVTLDSVTMKGKYSFQYVTNLQISNSNLDTKDAFWHADNVVVTNCTVKGEYLGWYSNNVTFVNCKIIGTQPLCYCTNLTLINCTMENTDLAFEYSDVDAQIIGKIDSVKNVKSGSVVADDYGEIISCEAVYPCNGKVIRRLVG